jgi:hypothetical protein
VAYTGVADPTLAGPVAAPDGAAAEVRVLVTRTP